MTAGVDGSPSRPRVFLAGEVASARRPHLSLPAVTDALPENAMRKSWRVGRRCRVAHLLPLQFAPRSTRNGEGKNDLGCAAAQPYHLEQAEKVGGCAAFPDAAPATSVTKWTCHGWLCIG